MQKTSILEQTAAETVAQDTINQAAGNAHWAAYAAALAAGESAEVAMQKANAAQRAIADQGAR